jgi:regulatory protein SWI6
METYSNSAESKMLTPVENEHHEEQPFYPPVHASNTFQQNAHSNDMMPPPSNSQTPVNSFNTETLNRDIYSAVYSGVAVFEMMIKDVAVMRRRKDSYMNATQILKVGGIDKGKRTKILEKVV